MRLLNEGQSIRHTAKITGKGVSTVQRVKAASV
ncbi:helix-turn-helix domain-containing protein [Streptococcus pneumoniae]